MTSLRIIGEPNHYETTTRDQHHFLGLCDECDAHYLRFRTLDEVDNWYRQGVIGQDEWEGFTYAWATSVPAEARWGLHETYAVEPVTARAREFAELVRRIAR